MKPLLACHLIILNKRPGEHSVGIWDTAHYIIAKVVMVTLDVQKATGYRQMCGGQISGIEAAVHITRSAFELENKETLLLVDDTNAFNRLNRQVALHNIMHLCPPIATMLINSHRSPTKLLVDGDVILLDGDVILSQEGTTQGD